MNELKCPECGQELKQDYYDCIMFECHNPKCKHYYDSCIGREELWQELIRTQKALEIAKDTLHWYNDNYDSVVAQNTLDEIKTALEKKEQNMCPQVWVVKKTVSQYGWTRYELSDGTVINDMTGMFGPQMSTATPQPQYYKTPETTEYTKQHQNKKM